MGGGPSPASRTPKAGRRHLPAASRKKPAEGEADVARSQVGGGLNTRPSIAGPHVSNKCDTSPPPLYVAT